MAAPLRQLEHERRAEQHREVGALLVGTGDEWAAVPLFYSAYHVVKAALLTDPIWDTPSDLHRLHVDLIPGDRFTDRHKGRRRSGGGEKEWGINELVLLLYRPFAGRYDLLHQNSITVRYGKGLPEDADLGTLLTWCDEIREGYADGRLVTTPPA